jgi:hypothetical protein
MTDRTFQQRLSSASSAVAHGVIGLVREMIPVALFFFVAFFLIFLIFKLLDPKYSIEFSAFTRAAVAAQILSKIAAQLGAIQVPLR